MLVANMKPEFLPAAESATALVAASVIVTSILVPIITAYYSDYMKKKNPPVTDGPVDVQAQKAAI
ncbi:2-keto-3-deoxygluconate permease [compost metagenome]